MESKSLEDVNYYEVLDLTLEATGSDIRRAYKKKALKCHPDKNPDNPKAAEQFLQLTKALEVLLDESARSAYDRLLKAKEAAKLRHKALDDRRKRFKEDLEAREQAAAEVLSHVDKYQREFERLQKEAAQTLKDEIKKCEREMMESIPKKDLSLCLLKATWDDVPGTDCQYNQDTLRRIFSKYGEVVAVAALDKKAIIEISGSKAAEMAVKIEVGFMNHPLKVTYADSKLRKAMRKSTRDEESLAQRSERQAAERLRLIEEMKRQDAEG